MALGPLLTGQHDVRALDHRGARPLHGTGAQTRSAGPPPLHRKEFIPIDTGVRCAIKDAGVPGLRRRDGLRSWRLPRAVLMRPGPFSFTVRTVWEEVKDGRDDAACDAGGGC